MPKPQQSVKAYHGTVLVARLLHEALVGLPVVRVLRVEFVGHAVFLQSLPEVVLVLKSEAKIVMGDGAVRVQAEGLAFFPNLSVPIILDPKRRAERLTYSY